MVTGAASTASFCGGLRRGANGTTIGGAHAREKRTGRKSSSRGVQRRSRGGRRSSDDGGIVLGEVRTGVGEDERFTAFRPCLQASFGVEGEATTVVPEVVSKRRGAAWFAGGDKSPKARVSALHELCEQEKRSKGVKEIEEGAASPWPPYPREEQAAAWRGSVGELRSYWRRRRREEMGFSENPLEHRKKLQSGPFCMKSEKKQGN